METQGFLMKMVERMGGDAEAAIAQLANSVTEEEAAAMTGRLIREAVFSATQDRRRLMAAAMAGTFSPDFEVEQKSRITRAIAQLEPSDIVALRDVAQGRPFGKEGMLSMKSRQAIHRNRQVSLAALEGAGCVAEVVVQTALTNSRSGRQPIDVRSHFAGQRRCWGIASTQPLIAVRDPQAQVDVFGSVGACAEGSQSEMNFSVISPRSMSRCSLRSGRSRPVRAAQSCDMA